MTITHLLEDFSGSGTNEPVRFVTEDILQDRCRNSFDQGYVAGWEDAVAAREKDVARLSDALSANLEDMTFTYFDALAQMNQNLRALFETLVNAVLPKTMADSFGAHIVEQLHSIADSRLEQPLSIRVALGQKAAVLPLIKHEFSAPLEVSEDSTLGLDQAYIRVGETERALDGAEILKVIKKAIEAHVYQTSEDRLDG